MAQATAIWIVSSIHRAVDDKTAKTLLGNSFRLQLKMDGTYTNVTFICSKSDDISVREAAETLDQEGRLVVLEDREAAVRKEFGVEEKSQPAAVEKKEELEDRLERTNNHIKSWGKLARKIAMGKNVTILAKLRKKRKRRARNARGRWVKKREEVSSDTNSDDTSDEDEPITGENINDTVSRLRSERESLIAELDEAEREVLGLQTSIARLSSDKENLSVQKVATCINLRNYYSKDAIRQDFVAGIKE
jgi:hypothetical protein